MDNIHVTETTNTEEVTMPYLFFLGGVMALLIILTEAGNTLTLVVIALHKSLRTEDFLFIPSLAVADAVAGIGLAANLLQNHGILCVDYLGGTLTLMLLTYALFVSHAHILAMALQRFLAVVFPMKYGVWVTTKRMYVAIAGMWITGAVYVTTFLSWGWQDPDNEKKCVSYYGNYHVPQEYIGWSQCTFFLLIFFTLLVTYGNVLRVAKLHSRKINSSISAFSPSQDTTGDPERAQESPQHETNVESRKALKFIAAAIGAYLLTWLMYFSVQIAATVQPHLISWQPWVAIELTAITISFSNSSLNIFIYSWYLSKFRRAYKRIICCCLRTQEVT